MSRTTKLKNQAIPALISAGGGFRIETSDSLILSYKVYGDYPEILAGYYQLQIEELIRKMDGLTIFDDAFEIRAICKKIILIRNKREELKRRFPA